MSQQGASGRTILVGDVHGCRDELDALLDKVAYTQGDRLVFVGDVVARGPDSLGVLALIRATGATLVRGNHEERLLGWKAQWDPWVRALRVRDAASLGPYHAPLAEAFSEEDWRLLSDAPLFHPLPDHGVCVVHAGVLPGKPVEEQDGWTLLHIRGIKAEGEPTDAKFGAPFWGEFYQGEPHIVFGHNALPEPQFHAWATGIDTGCVYGGELSALVLPRGMPIPRGHAVREWLVTQRAFRTYVPTGARPESPLG